MSPARSLITQSLTHTLQQVGGLASTYQEARLKTLLTTITQKNLQSVSVTITSQISAIDDPKTLSNTALLVIGKALDEPELCARLCEQIIQNLSHGLQGSVVVGRLFARNLLLHCKKVLDQFWAPSAKEDATRLGLVAEAPEVSENVEVLRYIQQRHASKKIIHDGLGAIQFMGYLYLHDVIPREVVCLCIERLLYHNMPYGLDTARTRSLCSLLKLVGKSLDGYSPGDMNCYTRNISTILQGKRVAWKRRQMLQVCLPTLLPAICVLLLIFVFRKFFISVNWSGPPLKTATALL